MSTRDEPRGIDARVADLDERLRRLELGNATDPASVVYLYDAKGDILVAVADNTPQRFPVGTDGQHLEADSTETLGMRWVDPTPPPFNGKGQLLVGLGPQEQGLLAPGTDGQVLLADATNPLGLRWADCNCGGGGGGMGAMAFAVVNESTVVSNDDVLTMTAATQRQVLEHLAPGWSALGATVTFYAGGVGTVPAGAIVVHIADLSDIAGDAGYHTIAGDQPAAYVFAKTITDGGGGVLTAGMGYATYCVAQVLSHEVCETFVDPHIQALADDFASHAWIVEVGDVVAEDGYLIDGVQMSDFALPAWFDPNGVAPYSYANVPPAPFSLPPGGYLFRYDTSGGTTEHGAHTPTEVIVADPVVPEGADLQELMLNTSVVRTRRAQGLPDPTVRVVRGRGRGWTPGS